MDFSFLNLLLLAFIGSIAGLIGGIIFLFNKFLARLLASYAVPFAAGVLLSISFLDLLPEAVEEIGEVSFPIILGVFLVLFLVEKFLFHLHHHNGEGHDKKDIVPLVIFGDTIHNLLDGVAIGASFLASPSLGLLVTLATFLHETPHEIADFGILISAGWSRKRAFWANFFSALATFPGAIFAYFYAGGIDSLSGILVAVAAGFFLYVSTTDFIPETKKASGASTFKTVSFLILGIVLTILLGALLPHA